MLPQPSRAAIVIPFYQRERGLLARCVDSTLAQAQGIPTTIIVVDDGSPVPADDELRDFVPDSGHELRLIRQTNAGAGAARNTGLKNVPAGTLCVAFLDSDDYWTAPFIADAVAALERGYDLFFGNSIRTKRSASRFVWSTTDARNIYPDAHPVIDPARQIHEFKGDFFDLLVYRTSVISTTAMAYRFDRHPDIRFDASVFNGQDRLFKLALGRELDRVAFSPKIYAYEGEGINIFDKSQWGSEHSLRFLASYIRLARRILRDIRLSPAQRAHVCRQLSDSRRNLAATVAHRLRRGKPIDWRRVLDAFRDDPGSAALFLPNLLRARRARAHQETERA